MPELIHKKPRSRKQDTRPAMPFSIARDAMESSTGTQLEVLQQMPTDNLVRIATEEGIASSADLHRQQLILDILRARSARGQTIHGGGTLELLPEGYGFLRRPEGNYLNSPDDIYVSPAQIRHLALRTGMTVRGVVRPPRIGENTFALMQVETVNGEACESADGPRSFEDLTALHPVSRLILETGPNDLSMRVVDLIAPLGKGQRGLIVSPPRAGKTVLVQQMAQSLLRNHPECYLFVLLIDERPEEVTEMRRKITGPSAEVISSTFDAPGRQHIRIAEIVLEKAKRLVEDGRDVVVLLDSITRLARAYNSETPTVNKTLSGGVTAGALDRPKRFLGAARNIEEGGSLTILATALIDTGSRMDEVIFEEFKGTGNMELHLDRRLVDRRVWPAIDINRSGTRREELLLAPEEFQRIGLLRKVLNEINPVEAMQLLTSRLEKSRSNVEFLLDLVPGRSPEERAWNSRTAESGRGVRSRRRTMEG
jgi:transcription termination factor Rho